MVFSILCKSEEEGVKAPKASFVASNVQCSNNIALLIGLVPRKKRGIIRAIICVKALSTLHCLGGCNFGAELGANLYMRAEGLSCNSPLRCCHLQFKFPFGIQIT